MRKLELKILIIALSIFILLFSFIPQGKEKSMFNDSLTSTNLTDKNSIGVENNQNNIIVRQIVEGNNSVKIENLSDRDKFIFDTELKINNEEFNKLNNTK